MKHLTRILLPVAALLLVVSGCGDSGGPEDFGVSTVTFIHVNPYRPSSPITFYREGEQKIGTANGYNQRFQQLVPNGENIEYNVRNQQNETLHTNTGSHDSSKNAMVVYTGGVNPDKSLQDLVFVIATKWTLAGDGKASVRFVNAAHDAGRRQLRIQEKEGDKIAEVAFGSANGAYVSVPDTVSQFWVTNRFGGEPVEVPISLTERHTYTIIFHGADSLEGVGRGWKGTTIDDTK